MSSAGTDLQNDFFNTVRKERRVVTVFLANGKKLTGRIQAFDKFTLLLENQSGPQMIFKHAISTVSTSVASSAGGESAGPGTVHPMGGAGRESRSG